MKQYLYMAIKHWIAGIILAVIIIIATGCSIHHFEPNCATKAANRALMAGEPTRIAMGIAPLKYGFTPGHFEAQKLIDGEWRWLKDSGCGVVATEKKPEGFTPFIYFGTLRFIELEFFTEFEE